MNCFHLEGRAFHSRSLSLTQQGCAALNKTPAGERHTKKVNLLQRSHNSYECLSTPAFIHAPPIHQAHSAPNHASALSAFDSRTTHARTLLPEALAYVPFGFILFDFEFYDASITDRNAGLYVRPRTLAFLDAETLLRKLDTLA